jgi:hypothetical protein
MEKFLKLGLSTLRADPDTPSSSEVIDHIAMNIALKNKNVLAE